VAGQGAWEVLHVIGDELVLLRDRMVEENFDAPIAAVPIVRVVHRPPLM
jgi:hypothetical protein